MASQAGHSTVVVSEFYALFSDVPTQNLNRGAHTSIDGLEIRHSLTCQSHWSYWKKGCVSRSMGPSSQGCLARLVACQSSMVCSAMFLTQDLNWRAHTSIDRLKIRHSLTCQSCWGAIGRMGVTHRHRVHPVRGVSLDLSLYHLREPVAAYLRLDMSGYVKPEARTYRFSLGSYWGQRSL